MQVILCKIRGIFYAMVRRVKISAFFKAENKATSIYEGIFCFRLLTCNVVLISSTILNDHRKMTKTILVVEDHPLYREAVVHMLQKILGIKGAVAVTSAEEGLRTVDSIDSLVAILLDLHLPGVNGMEAIKAFQRKCPSTPIIMLSASEDRRDATMALRAGAIAFVSKAASSEMLSDVVVRLLAGTLIKPEWIPANGKVSNTDTETLKFNDRQKEILALLLKGHSNKEIALHLGLAEITIKVHVSALFRLLGVVNRTQAVLAARRLGLGDQVEE